MAQVEKDTSVNDSKFSLHTTQSTLPTQNPTVQHSVGVAKRWWSCCHTSASVDVASCHHWALWAHWFARQLSRCVRQTSTPGTESMCRTLSTVGQLTSASRRRRSRDVGLQTAPASSRRVHTPHGRPPYTPVLTVCGWAAAVAVVVTVLERGSLSQLLLVHPGRSAVTFSRNEWTR